MNFDFESPTTPGQTYTIEYDYDQGNTDPSDNVYLLAYELDLPSGTYNNMQAFPVSNPQSGHYSFTYTSDTHTPASGDVSHTLYKIMFLSGTNTPQNTSTTHFNHYFYVDNFRVTTPNTSLQVVDTYSAEILETHDYYAFGYDMPGRTVGNDYRYGMNGQLKDQGEVLSGGFYSADYWGYDARLGRRLETDALAFYWQSPYATFDNNPIFYSDPLGLEATGDHDRKKRQDPVPEKQTRKDNIPSLPGMDANPEMSKDFPASTGNQYSQYSQNADQEFVEGILEEGVGIIANSFRFVKGLETGETFEGIANFINYTADLLWWDETAIKATDQAVRNHFFEYSPNTLGKDLVLVESFIVPFAFKAPPAFDVQVYEPGLISYEGIEVPIARGKYVEDLMVNDLTQMYPGLRIMRQARIKFQGYSTTMKADLVLIDVSGDAPVIKIIGESKYNGSEFTAGQKLLYIHKEYAILVDDLGNELYFNPDAVQLEEYRFLPDGTYNVTPY